MTAAREESIARTEMSIRAFGVELDGELVLPANAAAVVIHAGPRADSRMLVHRLARDARIAEWLRHALL